MLGPQVVPTCLEQVDASRVLPRDRCRMAANADVAQLVEHHLAKVRVAGPNPVIRSLTVSPYGGMSGKLMSAMVG